LIAISLLAYTDYIKCESRKCDRKTGEDSVIGIKVTQRGIPTHMLLILRVRHPWSCR